MIFVFLSIITYSTQNMANKEYGRRFGNIPNSVLIQDCCLLFFASLIMLIAGGFHVLAPKFMLLAAGFGCLYYTVIYFLIAAMKYGSVGGTTIMTNLGLFLSTLFGIFVYGDEVTVLTLLGMGCMLAVVLLSIPSNKEKKENPNKLKWFFMALATTFLNSGLAIIKRIISENNKTENADVPMTVFLFWAFIFAMIIGIIVVLVKRPKKEHLKELYQKKNILPLAIMAVLAGAGSACGNLFQMVAMSKGLSSIIVYPVCAGCLIMIAWLISLLFYREIKISVKNTISLILCIVGVILASL